MTQKTEASKRLSIRQLLVTTFAVAVGLAMATNDDFPIAPRLMGFAAGFYCLANCFFAFSTSLASPKRELLFLIGLPLYVCFLFSAAAGLVIFFATTFPAVFQSSTG